MRVFIITVALLWASLSYAQQTTFYDGNYVVEITSITIQNEYADDLMLTYRGSIKRKYAPTKPEKISPVASFQNEYGDTILVKGSEHYVDSSESMPLVGSRDISQIVGEQWKLVDIQVDSEVKNKQKQRVNEANPNKQSSITSYDYTLPPVPHQ